MDWIFNPEAWIALLTLTALEIVLGIDNIIFISILVGRLPENQRNKGRVLGLGFAMATRILLLLSITWVMQLTEPLFFIRGTDISGRDTGRREALCEVLSMRRICYESAMRLRDDLIACDNQKVRAQLASSMSHLARGWQAMQDQLRILRGIPGPGTLRPESKPKRKAKINLAPPDQPSEA